MSRASAKKRKLRTLFFSVCTLCTLIITSSPEKQLPFTQSLTTQAQSSSFVSAPFRYGRHYPNGDDAVRYVYGPDGMWASPQPLQYNWNYYRECETPNHLFNKNSLISEADGTRYFTTKDANCHLLFDWNNDGEIDTTNVGHAFFEHNGKGKHGAKKTLPFTNFWFDDNWLARYMSIAYARPEPNGLSEKPGFVRWKILGGDRRNWTPYPEGTYFDQLALNGLYYLAGGDTKSAMGEWNRILDLSGYAYDADNQRYTYPNIKENYHLGLVHILTSFLMDITNNQEVTAHWVSLRSHLLSNQEHSKGDKKEYYGWRTSIDSTHDTNLMNTETLSVNVLALGAGAFEVYEAGKAPLSMTQNNYYVRPHNVLSAVKGLSQAGFMTYGPYRKMPKGDYEVQFFLRSPQPQGQIASLDVYDAQNNRVLNNMNVTGNFMMLPNKWKGFLLRFQVENDSNAIEFRTYWHGKQNMDIATIRVKKVR